MRKGDGVIMMNNERYFIFLLFLPISNLFAIISITLLFFNKSLIH